MAVTAVPAVGELIWLKPEQLTPNAWNPNEMDDEKYAKEIASIRKFGMVDPITVREQGSTGYQIIDGEHRWKALIDLRIDLIPCFNLGLVENAIAQQLTIMLNELRGEPNREKLGVLLKDLLTTETTADLLEVLPFSDDAFKDLVELPDFDWGDLDQPAPTKSGGTVQWVERTFRLPPDAAEVVDNAIRKAQQDENDDLADWRALELICADYMGT